MKVKRKPQHPFTSLTRILLVSRDMAGRVGLFRTAHAIDKAVKEIGWEIADIMKGKQVDFTKKVKKKVR